MNKEIFLGLKFAFSYFSIFPIKFHENIDLSKKEILNYLIFFLPLIGAILSSISIGIFVIFDSLSWLAAIICAFLYMLFYGFIHTEAIADVIDALYAKHSGRKAYEVIKEPTIGAMGFLYTFAFVSIKISILVMLFLNNMLLEIISIAIISRVTLQFLIKINDFKSSFITSIKGSFISFKFSFLLYLIFCFILIGFKGLILFLIAFLVSFLFSKFLEQKLGFLNGDTLGFNLEFIEIVLFFSVCILWP